uniref:RPB6 homolog n=2 Tax=Parascaris univalens TaxID=6257 RepID=A0A915BNJ4_PARUN
MNLAGKMLQTLMFFLLAVLSFAQQWTAKQFPNPRTSDGYKTCKMRSLASVCDPDEILTESERYRLNSDLLQLARRTSHSQGNFCERKGIEAVLVIVQSGSQELASDLNKLWNIDGQCKKAVIFLLSAHDRKLYYSGEENTGLTVADFDTVVSEQHQQLSEGKFTTALTNILKQIGRSQNERTDTGNDASGHSDPRIPVDNGTTFTSFSFLLLIAIAVAILL